MSLITCATYDWRMEQRKAAYWGSRKSSGTDWTWVTPWSLWEKRLSCISFNLINFASCCHWTRPLTGVPLDPGGPCGPLGPGSPYTYDIFTENHSYNLMNNYIHIFVIKSKIKKKNRHSTFSPLGPADPGGPTGPGDPCVRKTSWTYEDISAESADPQFFSNRL